MGNIYDLYSNALGRTFGGNQGFGGGGLGGGVNMLTNMLPGGALLQHLLGPALSASGAGSWLSSLFGGAGVGGAPPGGGGSNPQQGTGLGFAPAMGPGGTGSGTGSGVGPYLPNTATPSLAELTGSPATAGAPNTPYAYGGAAPASTGVPEASTPPTSQAYVPAGEPGGSGAGSLGYGDASAHRAAAQGQAAIDAMHQFVAQTMGLPPEAVSATIAALQRAAQYRQALLGS